MKSLQKLFIEEDVKEFIGRLPNLSLDPPSVHLLMLAVRSRKAKTIMGVKIKDLVVERKVIRPSQMWRNRYFSSVYKLALLQNYGLYYYNDRVIPSQTMAIYATLSPRNVRAAVADLMKENVTLLYQHDESARYQLTKQDVRFFGHLHRHKLRTTHFVTLDLDVDDRQLLNAILDEVSSFTIFMVTETSRGYHIVLDLTDPDDAREFYGQEKMMQKLGLEYAKKGLEFQRDSQEPVPGTLYCKDDGSIHYVRLIR